MNEKIKTILQTVKGGMYIPLGYSSPQGSTNLWGMSDEELQKFAELIVKECINKIETYEIYVGCSPAGELACEWTYNSLKSIRDDIKEEFGIE